MEVTPTAHFDTGPRDTANAPQVPPPSAQSAAASSDNLAAETADEQAPCRVSWTVHLRRAVTRAFTAAASLAAPPCCAACGREDEEGPCEVSTLRPHLCGWCRGEVSDLSRDRCPRCAAPVGPYLTNQHRCLHCRRDRFRFEGVIRLGLYRSPLGQLCRRAKTNSGQELAAALADSLWEQEKRALVEARADLLVAVPHHWRDGYRTMPWTPETLVSVLERRLRVPDAGPILTKIRRTPKQNGLTPSQRRVSLKGAFCVPRRFRSRIKGRRLLLVDDILTTGATANEASRALLEAGCAAVVVAVLARALGKPSVGPR